MWPKLRRCFDHAEVELSNNLAENSMRPVALGRKNWLHVGSAQAGPKVAAILDWYGITDLNDMLTGPNQRGYAVAWFGALPNAQELARKVSPLTYVRRDVPPILIIHGDADPIVPYSQATRLRDALSTAGARSDMYTVHGGGHGNYSAEERVKIYEKIHEFLAKYKVM